MSQIQTIFTQEDERGSSTSWASMIRAISVGTAGVWKPKVGLP